MVKAIGTDIVSTARIEAALERSGRKFAERILAPLEMIQFDAAHSPAAFLAKRFAAKEAAAIRFVQSEIIALGTMKINRQH